MSVKILTCLSSTISTYNFSLTLCNQRIVSTPCTVANDHKTGHFSSLISVFARRVKKLKSAGHHPTCVQQ